MITLALTTIKQPDYEMGWLTFNMLIEKLKGEKKSGLDIMLQLKLVERGSVAKIKA